MRTREPAPLHVVVPALFLDLAITGAFLVARAARWALNEVRSRG